MTQDDALPEWKAAFLAKPSISVRKGISFGYEESQEESSVLVLTAPSGKFVDIRFPLRLMHDTTGLPHPLQGHRHFWAFSGLSETTFYDNQSELRPGFQFTAHTVFKHDIDSMGPGIVDEGDCFLLPNGDVMEIGLWHENGKLYKELWSAPSLLPNRATTLMRPIVVLECVSHDVHGRIIRIGDYIQGIYRRVGQEEVKGSDVLVERLHRDTRSGLRKYGDDDFGDRDGWILDGRSNTRNGQSEPFTELRLTGDLRNISLGAQLQSGGEVWTVTEYEP